MGLLDSLNCFSSSSKNKKRRKKQKQHRNNSGGGDGGGQLLLTSPLSWTSCSSNGKSQTTSTKTSRSRTICSDIVSYGNTTTTANTKAKSSSSSNSTKATISSTQKFSTRASSLSKKKYSTSLSTNLVAVASPPHTPHNVDDNSIPTIDSDYNKFNSQFSLSDAGGTLGSQQQQSLVSNFTSTFGGGNNITNGGGSSSRSSNLWPIMSPLSPFGQVTSPGEQLQQQQQQEEYQIIYAPSGVLGVVIDTPFSSSSSNNNSSNCNGRMLISRPVVHAIKDSCPIRKDIHVGDILVAVDDIDVTSMTAIEVSQLISRKSAQKQRKLTLIRGAGGGGGGGSRLYDRWRYS